MWMKTAICLDSTKKKTAMASLKGVPLDKQEITDSSTSTAYPAIVCFFAQFVS
jgi:hypothetical protein